MKILIADDHWFIRDSLKHIVKKVRLTLEPLEAGSFDEALDLLRTHSDIELMLIDLVMPGFSEFDGLRLLRASYPDVPVAVISVHDDREYVLRAIAEGVIGYIPKSDGGAEILRALTKIIHGEVYFPRDILHGSRPGLPADRGEGPIALTAREEQVLQLVGRGETNFEIARELGLSPNTVRVHLRSLTLKLKARDRSALAQHGITRAMAKREIT